MGVTLAVKDIVGQTVVVPCAATANARFIYRHLCVLRITEFPLAVEDDCQCKKHIVRRDTRARSCCRFAAPPISGGCDIGLDRNAVLMGWPA